MWWDESNRKWRRHPDCKCQSDPCVCAWLDPLDANGQPIRGTVIEGLRNALNKKAADQERVRPGERIQEWWCEECQEWHRGSVLGGPVGDPHDETEAK